MGKGNPNIASEGKKTQFSSENQPENKGRKGKSVSEFLKEFGEGNKVEFEITVHKDGKKKTQKGCIQSQTTINELIAVTLINNVIKGDGKALSTYLERTEGKLQQNLKHSGDDEHPLQHEVNVNIIGSGIKIANTEEDVDV